MKTITNSRVGLLRFECSNGYDVSIGVGSSHYSDNHCMDMREHNDPTTTMEVAIMCDGNFVCLPYDVAGYVPVARLFDIIHAVEGRDWERVCDLCDQNEDDAEGKFPVNHLTSSL